MKIVRWEHIGVDENGCIAGGGAVETRKLIRIGIGQGCGLEGCHCSDGYWLMICFGREDDGSVKGVTVYFDSKEHMERETRMFINKDF